MSEKPFLSIDEYAEERGYTSRTVRQMCINGKIPGATKLHSGRKWFIPRKDAFSDHLQRHWNDLADIAGKAAEGFYYRLISDGNDFLNPSGHKQNSKNRIPGWDKFFSDTLLEVIHPLEPFDWHRAFADELESATLNNSLIVHLESEFKGFTKKLQEWKHYALWYHRGESAVVEAGLPDEYSKIETELKRLTEEIIELLNRVAIRRTFEGTCDSFPH